MSGRAAILRQRRWVAALLLLCVLLLASCDGDEGGRSEPDPTPSPVGPSADSTPPTTDRGARTSLTRVICGPDDEGVWNGAGRLVNDTGEGQRFVVRFTVINPKTSEVLGSDEQRVRVAAGESHKVEFTALAKHVPKRSECIQHVTME